MDKTIEEANKRLVIEAFNTLFNKRDYKAAERFWSPTYIQHSAHILPGREGLFDLVRSAPADCASWVTTAARTSRPSARRRAATE